MTNLLLNLSGSIKKNPYPSAGKRIARGVGLAFAFGYAGMAADYVISTVEDCRTFENNITYDIDRYEDIILAAVNKLRRSMNCPQFDQQEVRVYPDNIKKSRLHSVGWFKKNGPLIFISIPVVRDGMNPSESPIYNEWVTEINSICDSIEFKKSHNMYGPKMRLYAEYNPDTFNINIKLSSKI